MLLAFQLSAAGAFAANKYWYGATNTDFNTASNWSTSNTGYVGGTSVPGSSDVANFGNYTGLTNANCALSASINVSGMQMVSGYTGTLTQNSYNITIGSGGATLSAGTFSGGSGSISCSGAFTISGCSFTSTSGTFTMTGNYTISSGSFTDNSGLVKFTTTNSISGSTTFYQLEFNAVSTAASYGIASGTILTVNNTLTISGSANVNLNVGDVNAKGDVSITNTATGASGSATITINGTGSQTLTGTGTSGQGILPKLTIDKLSGTLTLVSMITAGNDWTYTKGTVNPGTSSVAFYGTINLDGQESSSTNTMPFYNVAIVSGTTTLTGNLNVDHNLTIGNGTTGLSAGSNTIFVGGDWDNRGTFTYATSTVTFDGSGYQHLSTTSAPQNYYNFTSSKSSKSLSLLNAVKVNHAMTLTEGHIVTTSTNYLELVDNATLTGGNDSAYVDGPMRKTGNDAFTFPLGDTTLNDTAYHPLAMTAPSSTSDQFQAEYFASGQTLGSSLVDSLERISTSEYWSFKRNAGSSTPIVTLGWNRNSGIGDVSGLRLAAWDGSKWADYGQTNLTINWPFGTIGGSSAANFPSSTMYLTIGVSKRQYNGYATLKRKLDGSFYEAKGNTLYFSFEDEYNDLSHHLSYKVISEGNTDVAPTLIYNSNNNPLSYYGDNRFRLDLYTSSAALHSGYYTLEVTNEKGEKFYLRFHIS